MLSEVWRYPAKSMAGEVLQAADVGVRGIAGDRGWAVRDEVRGGIRGAKQLGGLLHLSARYRTEPGADEPPPAIVITLPDGSTVGSDDTDVDQRLTAAIDHEVTLWPLQPASDLDHYRRGPSETDDVLAELRQVFARTPDEPLPDLSVFPPEIMEFESPPGTYFDAFPLHVVTTASLGDLARIAPDSVVDVRRFRPNLVVRAEPGDEPFPERRWVGRRLAVGEVELDIVTGCPRCVVITRDSPGLPADRALMRTVVKEAGQDIGVYATVARAGTVRVGDEVRLLD